MTQAASPGPSDLLPTQDLPLMVVTPPSTLPAVRPARRLLRVGRLVPVFMLCVMLGGVVGLYFQPPGLRVVMGLLGLQPGGGTSNPIAVPAPAVPPGAAPLPPASVVALGRLLPAGDVTVVDPPFGAGDARIADLLVAEGDRVEAGQLLATLDNAPALQAALARSRAALARAEAAVDQSRATVASSRDEAQAALAQARATAANAASELARSQALFERGVLPQEALDRAEAAATEAREGVARAGAQLARFGTGPLDAQPDVVLARRSLEAARADLAAAEEDLARSTVLAPQAGTVLDILVRPGERPGAEGILEIGNTAEMTAELEVYQSDIARVAPGQRVEITGDALDGALTGTVARVGLEVGRQTLLGASPAANTDARVVKVTVALDPDSSARAARLTNLQVTGRILLGEEGAGP